MKMYQRFFIALVLISSPMLPFTDSTFSQTTACSYYASPTGTGKGSQSSPFKISDFWAFAKPGTTLCLLDGTYRGVDSMIQPPTLLSGSAGQPITVKCLKDGACDIDGEGVQRPVWLPNNSYFTLEGFDAYNSSADVIGAGSNGIAGSNLTIRRVVAWDAPRDANRSVWAPNYV